MKKLIGVLLIVALLATMSVTALAADITPDTAPKTGDTAVTFNIDPTYSVTIPATVELDKVVASDGTITYEKDMTITASDVRLEEDQKVEVTLTSDFKLDTADSATYKLDYTVTVDGDAVANNGVVAAFGTDTAEQSETLHFVAGNPTYAGDYSDTVTFTISVVTDSDIPDGGEEI